MAMNVADLGWENIEANYVCGQMTGLSNAVQTSVRHCNPSSVTRRTCKYRI